MQSNSVSVSSGGHRAGAGSASSLGDFSTNGRVLLLCGMAVVIGVISAFVAEALLWLIAAITNLAFHHRLGATGPAVPQGHHLGWTVVLVPVIGALIIGLMARFGSEKIRGHGIPEALEAILLGRSRMEPKVALLKPLSAAISIGTGGPFGAEGPIIMTGGALGSIFAQQFHLSSAERKTLLVAGAAAGMSAVFGSPVAALLLAVELLLFEWKPRSFIPVAVAAIVASILRVPLLGGGPIFPVTPHAVPSGFELLAAVGLGVLAGFASGALTGIVYFCEDLFQKLPIHWMWWPAIGAVFIGIGGWYDPRVLGVGYDTIHAMLRGELIGAALAGLLITKAIIWSIALGSGTSGGVLAPLLIMGGALGALVGHYIPQGDPGMWALIGMAAMMGGTMRSPLTAMVFAVEVTHDYNLFPALFIGSVAALGVTVLLMKRSILTEKLARRGHHITREYSIDPFELVRVRDVMDDLVPMVPAKLTLAEFATRLNEDPDLSRRQGTVIVDERGKLAGMITRGDLFRAMREGDPTRRTVLEVCSTNVVVAYPDDSLHAAVTKMLDRGVGRLPVVGPENPERVVGYLGRAEVLTARSRLLEEEHVREARGPVWGWGAGRRLKQS